jgi:malonyl CoA-acyl carrier protein transacylase
MKKLIRFLGKQWFNAPKVPVIANIGASPYATDTIRDFIADLPVSRVRWFDSICYVASARPNPLCRN